MTALFSALILILAPGARAHEHHEHSMEMAMPSPGEKSALEKQYPAIVTAFVQAEVKASGQGFVLRDEKTGQNRILKLEKIHRDKIVMLQDDLAFACVDFRQIRGGADKLDLDFYVSRIKGGPWKVSRVLVHKVNGVALKRR